MTPTQEQLERWAREAGCFTPGASRNYWAVTEPSLARFAELVRADERERIALHFDQRDKGAGGFYDPHEPAEIIRALP